MSPPDGTEKAAGNDKGSSLPNGKDRTLHGAMSGSGSTYQEALLGLASGIVFGAVSPIVGHPFDTVKTRMQAELKYHGVGTVEIVRNIYRNEGIFGFYRGFVPPLLGSMAFRGVLFSAYSGTYAACEHVPILHQEIPFTGGLRPSVLLGAVAASVSRAAIESPFDFVKVRYMVGKGAMEDGIHHANQGLSLNEKAMKSFKTFLRSPVSSVSHFYHGFGATLARTMGLLGSFFVMVDYSVRYAPELVNTPLIGPFFKGGVCATAAWVFAFPFESAKSVIQADTTGKYRKMRNSTWAVMKQLYKERGLANGLYRGFLPGASRSFFANGTSMIVYAWFQDSIRS